MPAGAVGRPAGARTLPQHPPCPEPGVPSGEARRPPFPDRAVPSGEDPRPQGVLLQRKAASGGSHSILFESSGWLSVEATTDRRNTMDDDDTLPPSPQPAPDNTSGSTPPQSAPVTTRRRPGRFAVGMAAGALGAGVGGGGAGYAVGHRSDGTTDTTVAGGNQQAATSEGPDIGSLPN